MIQQTPGVCGGNPCIGDTRIPVWQVWSIYRETKDLNSILDEFPQLTPSDVLSAIVYTVGHRKEIEQQIAENETA